VTGCYHRQRVKGSFQTLGVLAACAVSWTCSVYDADLLSLSPLTAGGSVAEAGGTTALPGAGTSTLVAGNKSSGGGTGTIEGSAGGGITNRVGVGGTGGSAAVETTAGEGGMGGDGSALATCESAPIPLKGSWHASASHSSVGTGEYDNKPEYAMDLTSKRWSTGKGQSGDEWLQVDFGASATLRELTFTLNLDDAEDYPRIYQIKLSDTPLDFNGPIRASGSGLLGQTLVVTLADPVQGRYLLVQQKGKDASAWWSVSELSAKCF
jgi:hypothetical protein